MIEPFTFLILGVGFGFLHTLEPDHLAGVASIASTPGSKITGFRRGAVWGIGHTLTIFILYFLIQELRLGVDKTLFMKLESLVGVMLIFLGLRIWYKLIKEKYHFHQHRHGDDSRHLHFHPHKSSELHEHLHLPFSIGVVHGLAGSGAIILALTLEIQNQLAGALYIFLFGAGSCVAMGLFSGLLAGSIDKMSERVRSFDKVITTSVTIVATVSCILGYEIIINSGVF